MAHFEGDVEELSSLIKRSEQDPTLLNSIQQANLRQRNRPYAFFTFPGTKGSMMSLPPFQKWPIQMGWSFSTWLLLDPKACAQPYLYNFKTGKSGLGYSAHFTGNCLVLTSIRVKGKGMQHCVAYEFPSHKWMHCAITYHNKWRAAEIKVYVNGQLTANIEMPWQVQTGEIFDKCFIGGSGNITANDRAGDLNSFSGQMSAIYLFNEGLSATQICAIHRLGPSYMGQFKYSNESYVNLPPQISKTLYEDKLASTLFCLFTAVAVDSGTLCIQLAPFKSSTSTSSQNYFVSAPHAALQGEAQAIVTQPICSTLQSLGCTRSLLPLLEAYASSCNSEACTSLIAFLCDLLESSPHWFASEMVQNNGFVIVAKTLAINAAVLLTEKLLDTFLNLTRTLLTTATSAGDTLLLKNLIDNILFNPSLWVYAETTVQIKLYSYLATEFLHGTRHSSNRYVISSNSQPYTAYTPTSQSTLTYSSSGYISNEEQLKSGSFEAPSVVADLIFGEIRRVSTVLQSLHALKYYYWIDEDGDINHKARNYRLRPNRDGLTVIRAHILEFTRELIARSNGAPLDEVQGLLNYLAACSQPNNILDVMDTVSSLIVDHPSSMVMALDQKQAIKILLTLIGSSDERVCVKALRLLSLFLSHCSYKKKQDIMGPNNLFMLICDRLRVRQSLSLAVYEALIDLLIEEDRPTDRCLNNNRNQELSKKMIVNSTVIKVIATLIHEQRALKLRIERNNSRNGVPTSTAENGLDIRKVFINDLWNLIVNSRDNRRIILQMSVWQHWLINLIDSTVNETPLVRDQILAIFRVLLYHGIRYECGGWRVWIDTLAIIHAKVSYDEFCHQINRDSSCGSSSESVNKQPVESPERHQSPTRTESNERKLAEVSDAAITRSPQKDSSDSTDEHSKFDESKQTVVSSISEHILNQSRGIDMTDDDQEEARESQSDLVGSKLDDSEKAKISDASQPTLNEIPKAECAERGDQSREDNDASPDSVDLAPSRAFRRAPSTPEEPFEQAAPVEPSNERTTSSPNNEVTRQHSMQSISLEDPPSAHAGANHEPDDQDNNDEVDQPPARRSGTPSNLAHHHKAMASPAFRIPEFKWSTVLIKLLNDLLFSIECDLYQWRCDARLNNIEAPPFVPKSVKVVANQSASGSSNSTNNTAAPKTQIEAVLQKSENQIYIINVIHLISQLADNVIIAAGGLLPLLAEATGGTRNSSSSSPNSSNPLKSNSAITQGLTMAQANSLLYRLVHMIDMVVFAAAHINLGDLEEDKNTTNGCILRQCLRIACTVTVKNILALRSMNQKICAMGGQISSSLSGFEFPKDMFDNYQGCSLLSANGLFEQSALILDKTDLIANLEYSPHQNPNTSSMPSVLPFQTNPIKDCNKLLQTIDLQRIQTCIYHTGSTESRQSQFLALSSLYFISVLMVSKYRDIIEPKQKTSRERQRTNSGSSSPAQSQSAASESSPVAGERNENQPPSNASKTTTISSIEANLLTFGKMQPNSSGQRQNQEANSSGTVTTGNSLTDLLTNRLEQTLDTVCPLLKSIMCDFCSFLSKTLIGSHGQDLVNKEAERTFRRPNASPVEVVMLLCSQEWQNTLQKNAGMAFIELINEGRVLSHGMKDHIVRVAMEADFIVSRLRADDVAKHEHFGLACSESLSARLHEEVLINSLISSAARRDHALYCKFKEMLLNETRQNYKLDIWEDDDRRKRRYVFDSWDDRTQVFYSATSIGDAETDKDKQQSDPSERILEFQKTIEMGTINQASQPQQSGDAAETSDLDNYDEEEDEQEDDEHEETCRNSISEADQRHAQSKRTSDSGAGLVAFSSSNLERRSQEVYNQQTNNATNNHSRTTAASTNGADAKSSLNHQLDNEPLTDSRINEQIWDYDECGSVSDFTGSVVFAVEASLIWSIYAIPGVLQVTTHELHFEPNQNIMEAIGALTRDDEQSNEQSDQQADDEPLLKQSSLRLVAANGGGNDGDSQHHQQHISLRKIDLKALRYCDFLTCNGKIPLSDIRAIFSRHYLLQPTALEVFVAQRTSVMFAFSDFDIVKRVVKYLPPVGAGIKYGIPQSRRASLMSPRQLFAASNMTQRWQRREIGNFQYLIFLNTIAGRTYQDLNQYPVFPWILTDYESDELDLNLPKNFRDLSKPIGALNNKRRNEFIERHQSWDNPKVPAFHYGTHYSTAAFTLNWLCRLRGMHNASYLALQDGKYEENSRLFLSIGDSWVSALSGGHQNVKELIPEFFYLPEMFHTNLGLAEVEYPPWAKSAEQFVRMHRLALESELVSCQLHQWIDLIFGYKQRGPEAVHAVNTFYHLTYQGSVNLNMIQEPAMREAIATQIKHFGQTPSQLTTEPHPPRFSALHASPLVYSPSVDEVNKVIKFPFNNPVVHISSCINNHIAATVSVSSGDRASSTTGTMANLAGAASPSSVLTITSNNQYQIHKWMPNEQSGHPFSMDPQLEGPGGASGTARRQLIDVEDLCSSISLKLTNKRRDVSGRASEQDAAALHPNGDPINQAPHYGSVADDLADEVKWPCAYYVVTLNGKYIIMGSFYDNSFRVFTTEGGKLCQVIYGHRGAITCIARSEGNPLGDFYLATGGQDCALLIWSWNERYAQVEGSGVSAVHNPLPKLCVCGHQSAVLSALICSELGLIVSGSKSLILVHTITTGENLIQINMKVSDIMERTLRENQALHKQTLEGQASIQFRPHVQDKQKTILEASMLGEGSAREPHASNTNRDTKETPPAAANKSAGTGARSESPTRSAKDERLLQLKDLCCADYYITGLQFARELAFIACVALPPPRRRPKASGALSSSTSSSGLAESGIVARSSPALLLTFNLKGSLMDSTPIGQSSANAPRLGDVCALQASHDGEFLILNDSPITIKIYKTFGLQPMYAYNTNDIPHTLNEEQNRIKSLALLDHKFILVGLDSGKLIVYNCDFKNL